MALGTMSRRFGIKVDASDLALIRQALKPFDRALASKLMVTAFKVAGRPIVTAARRLAKPHEDTGTLRKAIDVFPKKNRKTGEVYALLTARSKKVQVQRERRSKPEMANPAKYLHLVELGTTRTAAKPMLQPAVEQNASQFSGKIADGLAVAIASEIRKTERRIRRRIT
jgi:HK97 gp10 family phage protein